MTDTLHLVVRGARGSMAVSGPQYARYGGNTTSFHVDLGGNDHLVIDAGTGLRPLEHSLGPGPNRFTVLLTHYHWDHIQGLPMFSPIHDPSATFRFVGATHAGHDVRQALGGAIGHPWFPVFLTESEASIEYLAIQPELAVGPVTVRSISLSHPQGATGYRLDGPGDSVVIATDHEAGDAEVDAALAGFAAGAGTLIHDAQYSDREYVARKGWGHSTPDAAVDAALASGVRRLVLTSHDVDHSDGAIDELVTRARARFPLTTGAYEGLTIGL
jgi:phosphoribosyl 1,2-cyclic phosphodiesterase